MDNRSMPLTIKNITLKNRLVMPPMATYKADATGKVNSHICDHYREKSNGGHIGLVIAEHCYVSNIGKARSEQISVSDDRDILGLSKLAQVIHSNHTPVFVQINHAGGAVMSGRTDAVSASEVQLPRKNAEVIPRAMTYDEIQETIEDFACGARRVQLAGFDGVEIHGAHGYLLNQFFSPLTNHRTDVYGGSSVVNRIRLCLEIISAVREAVGPDYPIALRLGACDYQEGGITLEDSLAVAPMLEQAGVDLLDISGGFCGYRFPGATGQGYFSAITEAIRQRISIPVILTGGIIDPYLAEKLLAEGKTDLVGVGRAILRDSNWPARFLCK